MGGLAFAANAWQVGLVLTLGALGGSTVWAGQNTILTSLTDDDERQKVFGLQFALLNLGIGVGAAVSGSIVDTTRAASFQLIYVLDMFCYLAPIVVLLSMPRVGLRLVERQTQAAGRALGGLSGGVAAPAFPASDAVQPAADRLRLRAARGRLHRLRHQRRRCLTADHRLRLHRQHDRHRALPSSWSSRTFRAAAAPRRSPWSA